MNKQILTQFGKRVRQEREKKGYSQERLGELAKVHRTYIGMIERAEKNITLTNMEKIARLNKFRVSALGHKQEKTSLDIDVRNYAKYLLKEGTLVEKRELLSCLQSKLILKERKNRTRTILIYLV